MVLPGTCISSKQSYLHEFTACSFALSTSGETINSGSIFGCEYHRSGMDIQEFHLSYVFTRQLCCRDLYCILCSIVILQGSCTFAVNAQLDHQMI